jgi:hypothetical protein
MPGTPEQVPGFVDTTSHHSYLSLLGSASFSGC